MYAYDFIGKRYDVGNRMGFLQATLEFALKRDDLRDEVAPYLKRIAEKL
jgi:UTP--glucose-1-phosphate uridylyltransferase